MCTWWSVYVVWCKRIWCSLQPRLHEVVRLAFILMRKKYTNTNMIIIRVHWNMWVTTIDSVQKVGITPIDSGKTNAPSRSAKRWEGDPHLEKSQSKARGDFCLSTVSTALVQHLTRKRMTQFQELKTRAAWVVIFPKLVCFDKWWCGIPSPLTTKCGCVFEDFQL